MLVLGSTYIYCVHNNWIGNQITYTLNEIYWIEYVTDRAQTCVEKKLKILSNSHLKSEYCTL